MSERELELEFSVAGQPKLAAFVLVAAYVRTTTTSPEELGTESLKRISMWK